jgi:nucleoside-diphosphate-sugar epimerase
MHGAAVTHARRARSYREVNVDGTQHIVKAAAAAGVERFVLLSSRTAGPASGWYGESKLAAEHVVAAAPFRWTILRLAEIYGTGSREGVDDIVDRARAGRVIVLPGGGESEVCPLHADDAARACAHALDAEGALGQTIVLGGGCLTLRELAARCIELAGSRSRTVNVPWGVLGVAAFAARALPLPLYPDQVARLRAEKRKPSPTALADLGVTPRELADGLRDD